MKRRLPVQQALEWAFRAEKVQLEWPDDTPAETRGIGFGMEYVLLERARLGGVRIDTSHGRSYPHEDAETIAAALVNLPRELGGRRMAGIVAECARTGLTPDWMPGAQPQAMPVEWCKPKGVPRGKTELLRTEVEHFEVPHPKNPARRIRRRRKVEIRWTPIRFEPHPDQIADARRGYARWWAALDHLRASLAEAPLRKIEISGHMPPRTPWLTREALAASHPRAR